MHTARFRHPPHSDGLRIIRKLSAVASFIFYLLIVFFKDVIDVFAMEFQVNVSKLGLVTPGGKVVCGEKLVASQEKFVIVSFGKKKKKNLKALPHAGKYAQVTNDPENDGCMNAVLLV